MVEEEIRLRYSGFTLFASKLFSVATGLLFTIMVTRSTSEGEFGVWGNLSDVLNYFVLLATILPFWTTRFTARKYAGSAKTGFIANLLMSILFASLYLILLPTIMLALNIVGDYTTLYTIASIQVLELYSLYALEAILIAKQPQMVGYGSLIFETSKVAFGFVFILQLKLGLVGVICSIIGSYTLQLAFYFKLTANELKGRIQWIYLKEWLKASPISVYNIVGNAISTFVLIFLFVYGGELARGYYAGALAIANIVNYSAYLASALYPRLLYRSSSKDVFTSLKMVMMFAVPMTAGAIVLSESYLTILKSAYAEARPVLFLLTINILFVSLSQVFNSIVQGTERVDAEAKISFRKLVKSRLFLLFTLPYIQSAVTLPTTFFVLTFVAKTPLEAATYLALILLLASFAMLIVKYTLARRCLVFNIPWKNVSKYALASAIMTIVLLVIPHPTRLSTTVAFTLAGAAIYLTILALIDKETKSLLKSVLEEVMRTMKIKKP